MCGIVGMIAPRADREWVRKTARKLLLATEVRGKDATGIGYHIDGKPYILKDGVPAHEFVYSEKFDEFVENIPGTWIGHCRAATQGCPTNNNNNHPLVSESTGIILVHNGHVEDRPWRAVRRDTGDNPYILNQFTTEVDSEALLRCWETLRYIPREPDGSIIPERVEVTPKDQWVPEVSWATAAEDLVYNMGGTFAFAGLIPEEPDTVYLFRVGRPLYLAYLPEEDAIVFASTQEILKNGLETCRVYHNYFVERELPHFIGKVVTENQLVVISATKRAYKITTQNCETPKAVTKPVKTQVTPGGAVYYKTSK